MKSKTFVSRFLSLIGLALIFCSFNIACQEQFSRIPIHELHLKDVSLGVALSKIAYKYSVPIGIELPPETMDSGRSNVSVEISEGTFSDVLTTIFDQAQDFRWELRDGVINVIPKGPYSDGLLSEIINTRINRFSIDQGVSKMQIRHALTKCPEIQKIIGDNSLEVDDGTFSEGLRSLGKGFSLHLSNTSIRDVLNSIVKDTSTRYWIATRTGENGRYFFIGL
jgi:hypothetical protein